MVEEQANLANLMDISEDHLWSLDMDQRLVSYNRAFRQYLEAGCGAAVRVGARFDELPGPHRGEPWVEWLEAAEARGIFQVEYRMSDGRTRDLKFNAIVAENRTV